MKTNMEPIICYNCMFFLVLMEKENNGPHKNLKICFELLT